MQDTTIASVTEITGIPINVKKNWEAAAEKQGMSLVDFLITATNDTMEKIPTEIEINEINLSVRDQVQVAETLLNPPPLNEAMQKALREHIESMTQATKESLRAR